MYALAIFFTWWLLSGAAVRGIYHVLNPRAYDRWKMRHELRHALTEHR